MAVNTPMNTTDIKPKYEVIEYEGKPARLYPDGAIRNDKGQLLQPHPKGVEHQITTENSREYKARRWMLAEERTAQWITKEAQSVDPAIQDVFDAHAYMMSKQYVNIMESDKPNMDDAEKIAQAMGTMPRNAELRQNTQESTANDDMAVALRGLVEFLQGRNRDTVEGTVTDADV